MSQVAGARHTKDPGGFRATLPSPGLGRRPSESAESGPDAAVYCLYQLISGYYSYIIIHIYIYYIIYSIIYIITHIYIYVFFAS